MTSIKSSLRGKKVGVLVADGFRMDRAQCVDTIEEATPHDYDALPILGGFVNPDFLRPRGRRSRAHRHPKRPSRRALRSMLHGCCPGRRCAPSRRRQRSSPSGPTRGVAPRDTNRKLADINRGYIDYSGA